MMVVCYEAIVQFEIYCELYTFGVNVQAGLQFIMLLSLAILIA